MRQELANAQERIRLQAAQLHKVKAEAASQQALIDYLGKSLQSQIQSSGVATGQQSVGLQVRSGLQQQLQPAEDTGWTVEQATASVARVLKAMSVSQTS